MRDAWVWMWMCVYFLWASSIALKILTLSATELPAYESIALAIHTVCIFCRASVYGVVAYFNGYCCCRHRRRRRRFSFTVHVLLLFFHCAVYKHNQHTRFARRLLLACIWNTFLLYITSSVHMKSVKTVCVWRWAWTDVFSVCRIHRTKDTLRF